MKKIFSLKELPSIGREVLDLLRSKKSETEATVVTLSGDLGAGKTSLTQVLAKELLVNETVVSPTFVIMKLYSLDNDYWQQLVHIDAYRLKSSDELLKLGWKELIEDPKNLILLEWPEQVPGILPKESIAITLSHTEQETRQILID